MNTSEYDAFIHGMIVGAILIGPIFGLFIAAFIRRVAR